MPDIPASPILLAATRVAEEVAAKAADDVDRSARFPTEAIEALREEGLLGALVPVRLGGLGASLSEVASAVNVLGRHCSSAAMVFAMHQIQVACLVRHGRSPVLEAFTSRVATEGLLLASATSEAGVGGNVRTSLCALERDETGFRLEKQASVISYGLQADAVLATARRAPDSPANDQVLVVCSAPGLRLVSKSGWETLGFRGTCSLGFQLRASGDQGYVLEDSYGDISSHTMLPTSHVLWTSLWLGIAQAAADRARRFVQGEARKQPGTTPPAALRLAELNNQLLQMAALVHGADRRYAEVGDDPDETSSLGFAIAMNSLKVSVSTMVVDIVSKAMLICGMAGYREDSPLTLGRLLRDSYGAALMVNNDRINTNNAQLLLIHRGR